MRPFDHESNAQPLTVFFLQFLPEYTPISDHELISYRYSSWCCSLQKSLRLRRFSSDRDKIWQDRSSSKYTSIDRILQIC